METLPIIFVLGGVIIGMVISIFIFYPGADIKLSQEVADDICFQLTGNKSVFADVEITNQFREHGKLICNLPSYDKTQNIIVKTNEGN